MSTMTAISRKALGQATEAALCSLFGEPVEVRPEPQMFSQAAGVGVAGDIDVTVAVRVTDDLITFYAATMFGVSENDVSDVDRSDALLELTNILGGAAKTAMEGDNSLTIPYAVPLTLVEGDVATAHNVISFAVPTGIVSLLIVNGSLAKTLGGIPS
jgi:CheY-specific phosphatase CheX